MKHFLNAKSKPSRKIINFKIWVHNTVSFKQTSCAFFWSSIKAEIILKRHRLVLVMVIQL